MVKLTSFVILLIVAQTLSSFYCSPILPTPTLPPPYHLPLIKIKTQARLGEGFNAIER